LKGYIYITSPGTDPGLLNNLNDPLFRGTPTLGACMPNIRRFVVPGDFIFVVSGKTTGVQQYVVGGLRVAEKLDALAAYGRFPANRLHIGEDGLLKGNVIVNPDGTQHELDTHQADSFENRIRNFIVGTDAVALETPREVQLGRERSLAKLSDLFGRQGNRAIDVIGRMKKLDDGQVRGMIDWLQGIKAIAN
jgi:hypothetical protein